MVNLNRNGLLGKKPNWYRESPSRNLPHAIWVQHYHIISPDSFEMETAYSLHPSPADADEFKLNSFLGAECDEPEIGYVSQQTLDRILKEKDKTIFIEDD